MGLLGTDGLLTKLQITFLICCLSARMLSEVGPTAGLLVITVRSFTPRSAIASRQSVGHACGGPKLCTNSVAPSRTSATVSYTHLRAHETRHDLVCRLLLEKK